MFALSRYLRSVFEEPVTNNQRGIFCVVKVWHILDVLVLVSAIESRLLKNDDSIVEIALTTLFPFNHIETKSITTKVMQYRHDNDKRLGLTGQPTSPKM